MLRTLSTPVMPLGILSLVSGFLLMSIEILLLEYSFRGWTSTRLHWGLMGLTYQLLMAATTYRTLLVIRIVSQSDPTAKKIQFPIQRVMWMLAILTEGIAGTICFLILPNVFAGDPQRQDMSVELGMLCIGIGTLIKTLISLVYFVRLLKIFHFALDMVERSSRPNLDAIRAKKQTITGLERTILTSAARVLVSVFWVVAAFVGLRWFMFHISVVFGVFTVIGTYKFLRGFKKNNVKKSPTVTTTSVLRGSSGLLYKKSLEPTLVERMEPETPRLGQKSLRHDDEGSMMVELTVQKDGKDEEASTVMILDAPKSKAEEEEVSGKGESGKRKSEGDSGRRKSEGDNRRRKSEGDSRRRKSEVSAFVVDVVMAESRGDLRANTLTADNQRTDSFLGADMRPSV